MGFRELAALSTELGLSVTRDLDRRHSGAEGTENTPCPRDVEKRVMRANKKAKPRPCGDDPDPQGLDDIDIFFYRVVEDIRGGEFDLNDPRVASRLRILLDLCSPLLLGRHADNGTGGASVKGARTLKSATRRHVKASRKSNISKQASKTMRARG
jgi:hypothetical protein